MVTARRDSATIVVLLALGSIAVPFRVGPPASAASAVAPLVDRAATASAGAGRLSLPDGLASIDSSHPDHVVGTGTPVSCTSQAVVDTIALGGIITFNCGPGRVTIVMTATAKVVNNSPIVVLDGGGRVTLSGAGQRRILYMNTCDQARIWTTSHCQNQDQPRLTIQGLNFTQGNSTGDAVEGRGGGAVFVRGGRVSVFDSIFTSNQCDPTGPDLGGGALRVPSQFQELPVSTSTFTDIVCSNGAALSSIGVSWEVYNSVFIDNDAIGGGANPARPGTPGGGSGGAIYLDGNRFTFDLAGSIVRDNSANEGGGAIFLVSNDRTGELRITTSVLERNVSRGFETRGCPGIFFLGLGAPLLVSSTIT